MVCYTCVFLLTCSIRVSNELGAGNSQVAKLDVYVIVGIAVAEGIVVVTVLLSIRKVLGHAFSSDPKIISYAASMIPIVACGNFLDGLQCILSGSCTTLTQSFLNVHKIGFGSWFIYVRLITV